LVAEWLASPADPNFLFTHGLLDANSMVIELGCGIAGVIAVTLARKVGKYIATDMSYVLRGLRRNLDANGVDWLDVAKPAQEDPKVGKSSRKKGRGGTGKVGGRVQVLELDWAESSVESLPTLLGSMDDLRCILACDCVYNEALVKPFVETCAALCRLTEHAQYPAVCVIAQQLRSDHVFEAWLQAFHKHFRVWRIADELLITGLKGGQGYVIHVGILREIGNFGSAQA